MEKKESKKPKVKKALKVEKKRTIQKSLRVALTEKEILVISRDLAKVNQEVASLKSNISNLSQKISNGYEYRSIDVDVYFDYKRGIKISKRRDTGEIIEEQTMTDDDRQQEFKLNDKKKQKEKSCKNCVFLYNSKCNFPWGKDEVKHDIRLNISSACKHWQKKETSDKKKKSVKKEDKDVKKKNDKKEKKAEEPKEKK